MGAKASQDQDGRRFIVSIGVTGAGKSTLCNLIIGRHTFEESDGLRSATTAVGHIDCTRDGVPIRVVDTVGLLSTTMEDGCPEQRSHEETFGQFSDVTPSGVDVFLLTERYGCFTENQYRHFQLFKEWLGAEALKHTILVFTHIPNWKLQQTLVEGELPQSLKSIVKEVRCVVGVESKQRQSYADVLQAIRDVVGKNECERYSNATLQIASSRRAALQTRISALRSSERRSYLAEKARGLSNGIASYQEVVQSVLDAETAERHEERPAVVAKPGGKPWFSCLCGCAPHLLSRPVPPQTSIAPVASSVALPRDDTNGHGPKRLAVGSPCVGSPRVLTHDAFVSPLCS